MSVDKGCPAFQVNRRVPDFSCALGQGHGQAHRDPRTGTMWGDGAGPRGVRRKGKKYANPKLARRARRGV